MLLQLLLAALLQSATAADANCSSFQQPRFLPGLPGQAGGGREAQAPQISVVLMNWKRPENVKMIVNAMEQYDQVLALPAACSLDLPLITPQCRLGRCSC